MSQRGPWYPISIGLVVLNVAGGIFASLTGEPMHAFVHGAVAVGFAIWARHLHHGSQESSRQIEREDKVELLEADMSELERELQETRERLAFADQLLKNKPPSS